MSISNPTRFDYLKVMEFSEGYEFDYQYQYTYSLTCLVRNSVHIRYSDNSTYNLSFDVINDGTRGFYALRPGSIVLAGEQMFVIQTVEKKINGSATISISADQIVNSWFQRTKQAEKMTYNTSKETGVKTSQSNISYVTLSQLLHFYQFGHTNKSIDMMKTEHLPGFRFVVHGWFPSRPVSNFGSCTGKSLLTTIVETWPGTIAIGWGMDIHIFGYAHDRDKNGDLVSVREIETGKRIDNMFDATDVTISRDTTKMCNAIEVRSATYSLQKQNDDDENDNEENELVFNERHYFPDMLVTSGKSIKTYGLYASDTILDSGFTDPKAAIEAVREKMVLQPVISVTAKVTNPSRTIEQPIAGYKYTVGLGDSENAIVDDNTMNNIDNSQLNITRHVKLVAYDWYPFDSLKGCQMMFSSVDAGIIDNLKSTIIHDVELSPTVTQFKELQSSDAADSVDDTSADTDPDDPGNVDVDNPNDAGDDDSDDDDSGDMGSLPTEDSDSASSRPGDVGDDKAQKYSHKKQYKTYLPISDREDNAHISRLGNITLNKYNDDFNIRVSSPKILTKLRKGTFSDSDAQNSKWTHLFKADFHYRGDWIGGSGGAKRYYFQSDFYLGQLALFNSGLFTTTSGVFTFRSNIKDDDYDDNGRLKRVWHRRGNVDYIDDASSEQPGKLATVQMGKVVANESKVYHYVSHSQLSLKKNVHKLSKQRALKTILNTDIATYNYKNDDSNELEASIVIDDVNKKPKFKTPSEFVTNDGKNRKDSVTTAFLVKAVQALNDKIDNLNTVINKQNKQIVALENKLGKN